MTHFKEYYYYLKDTKVDFNNSLPDVTLVSSSTIASAETQKEKQYHLLTEEKIKSSIISDLGKWSEYKIKRLAQESTTD